MSLFSGQMEFKEILCYYCGLIHFDEEELKKCQILKNTALLTWTDNGLLCEICGSLVLLKDPKRHLKNCQSLKNDQMSRLPKDLKVDIKINMLVSLPLKSKMVCPVKECFQKFDLENAFNEYHEHHHEQWQLVNLNLDRAADIKIKEADIEEILEDNDDKNVEFVETCNPISCQGCGNLFQYQKDLENHHCQVLTPDKSKSSQRKFQDFQKFEHSKELILCDICGHFVSSISTHFKTCQAQIKISEESETGSLDKYLSLPVNTFMQCPVKDCHQHVIFQNVLDMYHENHVMVQKVRQMTEDHENHISEPNVRQMTEDQENHVSEQKVRQLTEDTSCAKRKIQWTKRIFMQKENVFYKKSRTFQVFCQFCNASFASKYSLTKHINKQHRLSNITCGACFNNFLGEKSFKRHVQQGCTVQHKDPKNLKRF